MKICIDAGHGLNTAGKRCLKSLDKSETREWYLNSRIALLLEQRLMDYVCTTLRVDDKTGKNDVELSDRVNSANNFNADIYLSIHHNAGANRTTAGGVSVFYYSQKEERKKQADNLYKCLISKNGLIGNRSTPVQKSAFYVLKNTKMPAFLIENGFMDSKTDVPIILTDSFAEKTVDGIISFLATSFGLKKKEISETKNDYEKIGLLFEQCMSDLESSKAFQELMYLL
jgi:N-acetylmuramoyl-L-alanine amidase